MEPSMGQGPEQGLVVHSLVEVACTDAHRQVQVLVEVLQVLVVEPLLQVQLVQEQEPVHVAAMQPQVRLLQQGHQLQGHELQGHQQEFELHGLLQGHELQGHELQAPGASRRPMSCRRLRCCCARSSCSARTLPF